MSLWGKFKEKVGGFFKKAVASFVGIFSRRQRLSSHMMHVKADLERSASVPERMRGDHRDPGLSINSHRRSKAWSAATISEVADQYRARADSAESAVSVDLATLSTLTQEERGSSFFSEVSDSSWQPVEGYTYRTPSNSVAGPPDVLGEWSNMVATRQSSKLLSPAEQIDKTPGYVFIVNASGVHYGQPSGKMVRGKPVAFRTAKKICDVSDLNADKVRSFFGWPEVERDFAEVLVKPVVGVVRARQLYAEQYKDKSSIVHVKEVGPDGSDVSIFTANVRVGLGDGARMTPKNWRLSSPCDGKKAERLGKPSAPLCSSSARLCAVPVVTGGFRAPQRSCSRSFGWR